MGAGFASSARSAPAGFTDSGTTGPASGWMTLACGDAIDGAASTTVAGCTFGAATTLAATGVPAPAGASTAVVGRSVATGAGV